MSPPDDARSSHDVHELLEYAATAAIRENLAVASRVVAFPDPAAPDPATMDARLSCSEWERTLNEVKARLRAAARERPSRGDDAAGGSANAALSKLQSDTQECVIALNHLHLKVVLEFRRLKRTELELLEVQAALANALTALATLQARGEKPR